MEIPRASVMGLGKLVGVGAKVGVGRASVGSAVADGAGVGVVVGNATVATAVSVGAPTTAVAGSAGPSGGAQPVTSNPNMAPKTTWRPEIQW